MAPQAASGARTIILTGGTSGIGLAAATAVVHGAAEVTGNVLANCCKRCAVTIDNMATDDPQERIIQAGMKLLADGGPAAMTTRAVSAAAGVHAPTIYRLFGDKDQLLDAVVGHGMAAYLDSKVAQAPSDDPVEDLRRGWDLHIEFGLENPAIYAAIYGSPRPDARRSSAERRADEILAGIVHRVAEAGRLAVPEARAAQLVHAAGRGAVFSLIGLPEAERDAGLSTLAREAVIEAITTDGDRADDAGHGAPVAAAVTLRAGLDGLAELTDAERRLMGEWLDRIAHARS